MRRYKVVTVLGCYAVVLACGSSRMPTPSMDLWGQRRDWLDAPVILVGVVRTVTARGAAELKSPWQLRLELHELTIEVENVIRGGPITGVVRAYRYARRAGYLPGNVPLTDILPGERHVFCLLPEGRDYRTVVDVVSGTFAVDSGRHSSTTVRLGVAEQVADMLMTPGEDYDLGRYLASLRVQTGLLIPQIVGYRWTVDKLRGLIKAGPPAIAGQACASLFVLSPLGDTCAVRIASSDSFPDHIRQSMGDLVRLQGIAAERDREMLRHSPSQWYERFVEPGTLFSGGVPDYRSDVQFLLTDLASRTSDDRLASSARTLLRRHFGEPPY